MQQQMGPNVPQNAPFTNLPFEAALRAVKDGRKIFRAGWNGKGMFVYYVPAGNYVAVTQIAKDTFGSTVPYGSYLALKTAQNNVVPWLASQTDILADDWTVME